MKRQLLMLLRLLCPHPGLVVSIRGCLTGARSADRRIESRILVLEQGQVMGLGTHKQLLATCFTYVRLWEAQEGYSSSEALPATPRSQLTAAEVTGI